MKCQIPQISWHSRDPVLSIDFQPIQSNKYRLASGGTDSHVLVWYITYEEDKTVKIECASDLNRHSKSVNVVRFSPNGETLVSGDDEGAMFVWQLREEDEMDMIKDGKDDEIINKEEWYPVKVLRAHLEDIYDISWSSDGNFLVTASMDNYAIIWDMQKYVKIHMLSDFKGYVQGVSWDPCNKFIASLGSDRTLRVHSVKSKKTIYRISKAPWAKSAENANVKARLFYDDTLKSYCRRLTYTPDGELLIVPSGITEKGEKLLNTCYVFSRHSMSKPVLSLHTKDWCTVAVRCNPFLYKLRDIQSDLSDKENNKCCMIDLPYRMIFAVAASDSVLMYDTEQLLPFACISNIHYTRLTDLAWSPDGLTLVASSTDGYCSFIVFTHEELGEIYIPEKTSEAESDKNCDVTNGNANKQEIPDAANLNTPKANKSTKQKSETPKNNSPKLKSETPKNNSPKQQKSETLKNNSTKQKSETPKNNSPKQKSETPKTETLIQQKSETLNNINNVTPKNQLVQDSTNDNLSQSSKVGGTSEKKFDKISPKMGSIKKYFMTSKTLSTQSPAARTTASNSRNLAESVATVKADPIVITLDSTPVKENQPLKVYEKKSIDKTPGSSTNAPEEEKMEVDNIDDSEKSLKKKGRCRMRLDFAEKDNRTKENLNIFISTDKKKSNTTESITTVTKTDSDIDVSMNIVRTQQELSSIDNKDITAMDLRTEKYKPVSCDEPMKGITNLSDEIRLSFSKDSISSKTITGLEIDSKKKIKPAPVILFDENASDNDNSTSVICLETETNDGTFKTSENDWKLELSQDTVPSRSDLKPSVPVAKVEPQTKPETITPKRRVAFVTLSSKPSFKK